MVSPSEEHSRPGEGPVTEGVGQTSHRFRAEEAKIPAGSKPGEHLGERPELVVGDVLVFHQLRRTKACATSIFNFHHRCSWWRVEKPVPEARGFWYAQRHDTNTGATPDSQVTFLFV